MVYEQRFLDEEQWYQARQCLPGAIIRCPHGKDPACECVKRFDIDKNCLITKQHITAVKAASCQLKQIKESNNIQKCNLLTQIIQSVEDKKDDYIKQYQSTYGPLLSSEIAEDSTLHSSPPLSNHCQRKFSEFVFILFILLPLCIAICCWLCDNF